MALPLHQKDVPRPIPGLVERCRQQQHQPQDVLALRRPGQMMPQHDPAQPGERRLEQRLEERGRAILRVTRDQPVVQRGEP